jgi:hypothetical protein
MSNPNPTAATARPPAMIDIGGIRADISLKNGFWILSEDIILKLFYPLHGSVNLTIS